MSTVVGHQAVRTALETDLPPVSLLYGPSSVGKWTLATALATHHGVQAADVYRKDEPLTIADVRDVIGFVSRAPFGPYKYVQLRLDAATLQAQNALLKVLEEPPPKARFLLVATRRPIPTVASRCRIYHCGLLSTDDITGILRQLGHDPDTIEHRLPGALRRGQVKPLLLALKSTLPKEQVLTLVQALATNDLEAFERVATRWDDNTHVMFRAWIAETLTGRWRLFGPDDSYGLHTDTTLLINLLRSLTATDGARSRLGIRTALMPFLRRS